MVAIRKGKPTQIAEGIVRWDESGEEPIYDVDISKIAPMQLSEKTRNEAEAVYAYVYSKCVEAGEQPDLQACAFEAAQFIGERHYNGDRYEVLKIRFVYTLIDWLIRAN